MPKKPKIIPEPKHLKRDVAPRVGDANYQRLILAKKKQLENLIWLRDFQKNNRLKYFNYEKPLVNGVYLRANPKQQLLLNAWIDNKYKTFVYVGGNRAGKTTIGVIISLSILFGKWIWNDQPIIFPHDMPRKVRLVSQDWESGVIKVIVPELKKWWPNQLCPYKTRKNSMGAEAFWIDNNTGSTLEIMTGNQDPMLHEGGHHDLVWFDEPISKAHYIANARGLVDRQGRELFTMTLLTQPWIDREVIKRTLIDPVTRKDTGKPDPSVFVVEVETTDNVGYGLTKKGLDEFAGKLTDEEYEIRIKGIPRYKKGLVYPMFKRDIHVKPRFRIPLDWPVDIAIDTHPRKPHSVLFMATDPKGYKFCCNEIRMHGNGKTLADEIVRMIQWGVYRVNKVIIDPLSKGDSNDPGNSTFDQIAEVLARYDMYLETASKNKDTGVLLVKEYLMSENQMASLFFFDDLVYTIRETESLMWEVKEEVEKVQKEEDDMPENLYRLVLLETQYTPPVDYDELGTDYGSESINSTTGY